MNHKIKAGAALICMLLCLAVICACAAKATTSSPLVEADEQANSAPTADSPKNIADTVPDVSSVDNAQADAKPEPISMEKDMGISVNGQWFPIWQDADMLLQALGEDYELWSAPSCVFEGEDKEFAYDGFCVYTNPDGDRDIWYSIFLESDAYATARGVKVGSALEETIAAYGDRYYWEGENLLTYSISGVEGDIASPCILFTVEESHVAAIEIYYPTNVS